MKANYLRPTSQEEFQARVEASTRHFEAEARRCAATVPVSAQFTVSYAGMGVRFADDGRSFNLVDRESAQVFTSEGAAWYAAYRAGLPAHGVTVQSLTTTKGDNHAARLSQS